MYVCNDYDEFIMVKYTTSLIQFVMFALANHLDLFSALKWMYELNLGSDDFELDSEIVVDNFHSKKHDAIEFGEIIAHCRRLFSSYYYNFSVEFIRRQTNEVAHSLAKTVIYVASSQTLVDILHCIKHLLINEIEML
jgi:hypothetical protein